MFVGGIGRGGQRIIDAMVRWLAYGHINPNILTVIGVAVRTPAGARNFEIRKLITIHDQVENDRP